jgi:hypothetical protein
MFRSTTIIRELVLNLAKVIFILKHSVKLRRRMLFGDVAPLHRVECVLCAVHSARHTTHTPLYLRSTQHTLRSICTAHNTHSAL